MARINVQSFDFDGCIFNINYIYSHSESRLIEKNEKFISSVLRKIQEETPSEVVFMVGSNRQSHEIDQLNSWKAGSCFPALIKLGMEFQKRDLGTRYRLDSYLLADTYGGRALGENFIKAIANKSENEREAYEFSGWIFDESKISVLYAQMHKLASENLEAEIMYDFYDDRHDILMKLKDFFTENLNLMPRNLRLRLHQYEGDKIIDYSDIQGEGEIDSNFQQNVRLMIACAGLEYPLDRSQANDVLRLLGKNRKQGLIDFINQRDLKCLIGTQYAIAPSLNEVAMLSACEGEGVEVGQPGSLRRDEELLSLSPKKTAEVSVCKEKKVELNQPCSLTGDEGQSSLYLDKIAETPVCKEEKVQGNQSRFINSINKQSAIAQEIEAIEKEICKRLETEMANFMARKKGYLNQLSENDQARYRVMHNLYEEVIKIASETKMMMGQVAFHELKQSYRVQLTTAVKASLLNNKLDKYNELEKIGIGLLNLIAFVFSPIKRLVTGTWFYSTQGKPKEAVQDILKIVKGYQYRIN